MIKKLIAVVLLMSAGFTVLYLATGGESLASLGAAEKVGQDPSKEDSSPGIRVPLGDEHQSEVGEDLTVSYRGELEINEQREIALPDGSLVHIELYKLHSKNSFPQNDGTWELQDVTVRFYETRETSDDPVAVEAGVLRAQTAYVEIGRDGDGNRSVAMDKDIVLDKAKLVTGDQARVKNLSMTIDRALVRSTESALSVRTAADNMPFVIEIAASDGPATLSGLGLDAEFPVNQTANGSQPMAIKVMRDPVLVHSGAGGESRLTADGPLTYREDPDRGLAHIAAAGHVKLDSAAGLIAGDGSEPDGSQSMVATGDSLQATMRRSKADTNGGSPRIAWHSMHLEGSDDVPAGLVGRGMALTCEAVDVAPNADGEPWLFTASGNPRLKHEEDGREMRFKAAERIHLVRIAPHLDPWLGGRGWSRWTAGPQIGELLIFEGASSLELPNGRDLLEVDASGGLRVLRGLEGTQQMTVLGRGDVQVASDGSTDQLRLSGNDGFLLHVNDSGHALRLGPRAATHGHRFQLETGELSARGSGAFSLFRPADEGQPGSISLSSPNADIDLTIPGTEGKLSHVATLTAAFQGGQVREFDAQGEACRLAWQDDQGKIDGTAARVHSTAPETWLLDGAPAVVVSDRGTFEGEHIRVVRLSEEASLLEASGEARLRARDFKLDKEPSSGDQRVSLDADRILYLPFAAARGAATTIKWSGETLSVDSPHLLAAGDVIVRQLAADDQPLNDARGDHLVIALDEEPKGRLRGAPATVTRRDTAGQRVVAVAPVVTFTGGDGQDLSLLPGDTGHTEITIGNRRGPLSSFGKDGGSTRITCQGSVDVTASAVNFDGPVKVTSLDPDGDLEREGFHATAARMQMGRNTETGEFENVRTSRSTELRWRGIEVRGSEVALDLVKHWCTLHDANNRASLVLPSGYSGLCSRAEFNYLTYESKVWGIWMAEGRTTK